MSAHGSIRNQVLLRCLAALVLFCLGVGTGWLAKPARLGFSGPDDRAAPSQPVGENPAIGSIATAEESLPGDSDFFSRVHEVQSIRHKGRRERAIRLLAAGLDLAQIQEALKGMEKSRVAHREQVIAQLFGRWGELDPDSAMDSAQALTNVSTQTEAVKAVLGAWVERDAAPAERWVAALPDGLLKNSAWDTLISAVAVADPKHALALAAGREMTWERATTMAQDIFDGWISTNPQEAARNAVQLAPGELRTAALQAVANEWARVDLAAALAWAEALPDQGYEVKPRGSFGRSPIYGVLQTWVNLDSAAAVNWLAQLPDDQKRAALVASARTFLSSTNPDPAAAMKLAMMLPEGPARTSALQGFAQNLARWEPASALVWMRQQTDMETRRTIMSGLLSHLAGDDLRSALEDTRSLDAKGREDLISIQSRDSGGTTGWSLADPATLAAWAEGQPDNQEFLNRIAQSWAQRDPERAAEWLKDLPATTRDTALDGIIKKALSAVPINTAFDTTRHFQAMERWILHLSSEQARQSAYEKLAQRWISLDPEFARQWLATSPLPQVARDRLLK